MKPKMREQRANKFAANGKVGKAMQALITPGVAADTQAVREKLAAKFPHGIAVFDLDHQKCVVCAPGQMPSQANVNSALSWMRWMGNVTIGIALSGTSLACFHVLRDVKAACLEKHKVILINAAAGLSPIDF